MYTLGRALAMTTTPVVPGGSTISQTTSTSTSQGIEGLGGSSGSSLPVEFLASPPQKAKKKKTFFSVFGHRSSHHVPTHESLEEEDDSLEALPPAPASLNKRPAIPVKPPELRSTRSYLPQITLAIQEESLYSDGAEPPQDTFKPPPYSASADQQGFLIHPALFSSHRDSASSRETSTPTSTNRTSTISSSSDAIDPVEEERRASRRRRGGGSSFARLQAMVELNGTSLDANGPSPTSALPGIDSDLAKRMEELGRARRLESTKKLGEHSKAGSEVSSQDVKPTNPFEKMVLREKSVAPAEEVDKQMEAVWGEVTMKETPADEVLIKEASIPEEVQTKPIHDDKLELKINIVDTEEELEMVGAFPKVVPDADLEVNPPTFEETVIDEEAELQFLVDTIKLAVEQMSPKILDEPKPLVLPEVDEPEPLVSLPAEDTKPLELTVEVVELIEVKEQEKPVPPPPPPVLPPSPPPITPPKDVLNSPSQFELDFHRSVSETLTPSLTPSSTHRTEDLEWQLEQQKKATQEMQIEKARREEQLEQQKKIAKDMQLKQAKLEEQLEQQKKAVRDMQIEQAKQEEAVRAMLEKMRRELHTAKVDNARLATVNGQQDREVQYLKGAQRENYELGSQLKESKEREKQLTQDLSKAQLSAQDLKKEKLHLERDVVDMNARLNKGKEKQHEQLDVMHHKLAKAERQIRSLDNLTRFKLQARQEGSFGSTKRKLFQSNPSSEVINAVVALNDEVLQAALLLVENLDRAVVNSVKHPRCKAILGNRLTGMLDALAKDNSNKFSLLLMQVVLEVFLVHWCVDIIDAHYPKQESFSDLLIEISAQPNATGRLYAPQAICGKQVQIIPTQAKGPTTPQYGNWVRDIFKELEQVLAIGGIRMRPNRVDLFSSKLLHLVKTAYNLRTALAEKDNLGGLELKVVSPDMPFQGKFMEDAHPDVDPRKNGAVKVQPLDFVVGTTGVGLQRDLVGKADGSSIEVVLKPKVVLVRVLREIKD